MVDPNEEVFCLAGTERTRTDYEALYASLVGRLQPKLPQADIQHIGATAIPGCLTKGDLDLVVRVPEECFHHADDVLGSMFARNTGSVRSESFAAFEIENSEPHVGIQLVAINSSFDFFPHFRDALRQSPELVGAYNNLKKRYNGAPMQSYRDAKNDFVSVVLENCKPVS